MKKILCLAVALVLVFALTACGATSPAPATTAPATTAPATTAPATPATTAPAASPAAAGSIKVGIINNPPSESGYRAANVADFESVFTQANGYDAQTFYSNNNDEQLNAAQQFITAGVDYLLISAAATDGWDSTLQAAQEAGIKVLLFDRMINCDPSLYEAAVVSDMAQEGTNSMNWLQAQKLSEYNVVHIQGVMGSDAQIGRSAAFQALVTAGTMNCVAEQTANWDSNQAQQFVESVINSGKKFNVIYAENDDMAKGAVAALDAAGITHGVKGDVIIMSYDCNKWALRELLAGNWNYDQQCSPFQASTIDGFIKQLQAGQTLNIPADKKVISEEKGFEATTITQADIDKYGLGN